MQDFEHMRSILVQALAFGLVTALWLGAVTIWALHRSRRRQLLERRLYTGTQDSGDEKILRLWREGEAAETLVPGATQPTLMQRLEQIRQDAGWETSMPLILLQVTGTMGLLGLLVLLLTGNVILATAAAVVVFLAFRALLLHRVTKRAALFEKQLVDALDLGARSLRAGHPLSGAFRLIAEEIDPPLNAIFAEIVDQESLGLSIQQALHQAGQRSLSPDMKIFAASVIIQLRSGGNLAEMMDRVAWVIRDRMRLNRRARVLTAEAQLSKWILIALPVSLFVAMNVMNGEYMQPFFTTRVGGIMLLAGAGMLCMGAYVMNRMSILKY